MKQTCERKAASIAIWLALSSLPPNAASSSDSFVIFGPALTPEYAGSEDYEAVPMLVTEFNVGKVAFEVEGLTAYSHIETQAAWDVGLTMNLDTGRAEIGAEGAAFRLGEIDPAIDAGPFAAYTWPGNLLSGDSLQLRLAGYANLNGVHHGKFGTVGLTYTFPLHIPWRFEIEAEALYSDSDYLSTYFGPRSDVYGGRDVRVESGFSEVNVTANTTLFLNPRMGIFLRGGVGQYIGDAGESHIVQEKHHYFGGLGLLYRFGDSL